VEPEVGQELITTIKIDQEEIELKAVTSLMVELEEETKVPDHKLLMKNQPIVELEEKVQEEIQVVEQDMSQINNELLVCIK